MTMTMAKISACQITECSYNKDKGCHALAITIGNGTCPMCDTYTKLGKRGGDPEIMGGVGACKSDTCTFNKALECTASSINVGMHKNHADCLTFSAR